MLAFVMKTKSRLMQMFRLQHEEYALGIITFVVLLFFHALIIAKFWSLFYEYDAQSWVQFMRNYHMSGFDPITYKIVTQWDIGYSALRHPLLPWMVYPLYLINQALWAITGANCAQLVVGVPLFFCGYYAIVFLYKLLHEVIEIKSWEAFVLCIFFLFFAHILVAMIVPDHFCISLFLILFTLYVAGRKMKEKSVFTPMQTVLLFTLTAGVTLSNGVITLMAVLMTNRRSFLRIRFLLPVAVVSVVLLALGLAFNEPTAEQTGLEIKGWLSGETLRWDVIVENLWGESILLHRQHILGDVLMGRPLVVAYSWWWQYLCEAVMVVLTLSGLVAGRKQLLAWLMAACFAYNFALHIVFGFAYNEVQIMACHWTYIVPSLIACLLLHLPSALRRIIMLLLILLTACLAVYHSVLLYNYLTWPVR